MVVCSLVLGKGSWYYRASFEFLFKERIEMLADKSQTLFGKLSTSDKFQARREVSMLSVMLKNPFE